MVSTCEYQSSNPESFRTKRGYDLLFSVDMVNLNSWWVGDGSMEQKVTFRAALILICCVPGFIQGWGLRGGGMQGELCILRQPVAKSRSTRGASHQPGYMGSCMTICQTKRVCPVHLVDESALCSMPCYFHCVLSKEFTKLFHAIFTSIYIMLIFYASKWRCSRHWETWLNMLAFFVDEFVELFLHPPIFSIIHLKPALDIIPLDNPANIFTAR